MAGTIQIRPDELQSFSAHLLQSELSIGNASFSSCTSTSDATSCKMHDDCARAYQQGSKSYHDAALRDSELVRQIIDTFSDVDEQIAKTILVN